MKIKTLLLAAVLAAVFLLSGCTATQTEDAGHIGHYTVYDEDDEDIPSSGTLEEEDDSSSETHTRAGSGSVSSEAVGDIAKYSDEVLAAESVSQDKYAYQTLDDECQQVYDNIVYAITNHLEQIMVQASDTDEVLQACHAVRSDYCSFFWLEDMAVGYSYSGSTVNFFYSMTESEREEMQQRIDAEADRMLADAPPGGSDYDKVLYVYDTLLEEVSYVLDSPDNQNIISTFINHETVRMGYAYGTQYLLEKLGVTCMTVIGSANGNNHAWNLVSMDGDWYYVDTTYGNSQYVSLTEDIEGLPSDVTLDLRYLFYDYFGVTTEEISKNHQFDSWITLPVCDATADNFYVHEGFYVDQWDIEYCEGITSIQYAYKPNQNVLVISMKK